MARRAAGTPSLDAIIGLRSAYCGSLVAIEPDGRLDTSIAIRTIIQKAGQLTLPVGGGIVHASEGAQEYQETLDKARALIDALT